MMLTLFYSHWHYFNTLLQIIKRYASYLNWIFVVAKNIFYSRLLTILFLTKVSSATVSLKKCCQYNGGDN